MLPKSKRLNLKKDFKFVASGNREETRSTKLFYLLAENEEPLVGIAITKKYFPKAHDRNKARRIASDVVEAVYGDLKVNINLVIMPKANILQNVKEEIVKEIKSVKNIYKTD
jgi:ribonuclease P protein component